LEAGLHLQAIKPLGEICIHFSSHAATFMHLSVYALPAPLSRLTIGELLSDFMQFCAMPSFLHSSVVQVTDVALERATWRKVAVSRDMKVYPWHHAHSGTSRINSNPVRVYHALLQCLCGMTTVRKHNPLRVPPGQTPDAPNNPFLAIPLPEGPGVGAVSRQFFWRQST
jgi:hypothetical protein